MQRKILKKNKVKSYKTVGVSKLGGASRGVAFCVAALVLSLFSLYLLDVSFRADDDADVTGRRGGRAVGRCGW